MNKLQHIIFDFDGTIVDSQTDIKNTLSSSILKIKGVEIERSKIKIGPPLEEIVRMLIPVAAPQELEEIIRVFRSDYHNCGFNKTFCYEGMFELLNNLQKQNKQLYIATNKPGYLTIQIIEKLQIKLFDDICTIDSLSGQTLSKKEMIALLIERNQLDKALTVHIGDSYNDVTSAQENGILSIGVGYGYETMEKIMLANPHFYFDTVTQLSNYLTT